MSFKSMVYSYFDGFDKKLAEKRQVNSEVTWESVSLLNLVSI